MGLSVHYVPHQANEIALINLAKSVDAVLQARLEDMLVPSAAAVEDTAKHVVRGFLEKYGLVPDVPLRSTIFRKTLPMIADRENAAHLRPELLESLETLQSWRNKQAHEGKPADDLNLSRASQVLCDAMLTVRYLTLLADGELSPRPISDQPLRF